MRGRNRHPRPSQSPRPRPAGRPPSTVISAGLTGILLPTTSPSFYHLLERTDVAVMLDIGHRGDLRHLPDSADNEYRPPHRHARRQRQRRPHLSQPTPSPPALSSPPFDLASFEATPLFGGLLLCIVFWGRRPERLCTGTGPAPLDPAVVPQIKGHVFNDLSSDKLRRTT